MSFPTSNGLGNIAEERVKRNQSQGWVWWCIPLNPALVRQSRWDLCEFQNVWGYVGNLTSPPKEELKSWRIKKSVMKYPLPIFSFLNKVSH